MFGPADSSDKSLWPLGPSGGPNFKLASFAGKNPATDAPEYHVIDLSNVAKWGGINGMVSGWDMCPRMQLPVGMSHLDARCAGAV